ncbi:MAG: YqaJ viral recombinase family protein [Candidatus Accumulibacter sp.]|nr:YqaJ viral recombinase family protein [Accumulibacter sp.]
MKHYDFEQGTPEWLEARKGAITGSKFKDARDRLKNGNPSSKAILYAKDVARERCGGTAEKVFQNAAMRIGSEQESFARSAYESRTGALVEPVGFFKTDDGMFGLSPDGLIDDDGVLEIKTMVSSDTLFTAVAEGDISAYQDQCDGYLWLLGRKWVDLVLWAPDMADLGLDMVIHRITRDEERIEKLEADLMAFSLTVRTYESALRKAAAANKEKESA